MCPARLKASIRAESIRLPRRCKRAKVDECGRNRLTITAIMLRQPRLIKLLIAAGESTISTITAPRRRRARHRRCRAAACEIVRDKGGYVPVTMQVEFFTLARDVIAGVCEGDSGEQEYDAVGVYPQPFTPRQSRPSDRGSSSVH